MVLEPISQAEKHEQYNKSFHGDLDERLRHGAAYVGESSDIPRPVGNRYKKSFPFSVRLEG